MPPAQQKTFEYDPADNLIGRLEGSQRQLLHYDATGRIIATQDNAQGQQETFAYDAAANLLEGAQSSAGLVRHNKLLTYQDKRYRYDGFGRMIEKRSALRGLQRFTYDAEHRLIEVHNASGNVVRMTYDPLGRRIAKTERDSSGRLLGETRFTWDGLRLLQEHKHSQTSLYVYADEGYEPLARVDGIGPQQKIRYYHNDLNGLPEQLTATDGHNVWRATYRVWGSTLEEVREPDYIEEQNLRFQGQYLDRETGLHFNTFRFYDPDVGRFATPDPIGLMGGLNLFQYAPNPIGWADPWGWICWGTARKNHWKEGARTALSGKYSTKNLSRMSEGKAPRMKVEVRYRDSARNRRLKRVGEKRVIDVSMELNHQHIPQRSGSKSAHEDWNLTKTTPWGHESMDKYRHTGWDVVRVIKTTGQW